MRFIGSANAAVIETQKKPVLGAHHVQSRAFVLRAAFIKHGPAPKKTDLSKKRGVFLLLLSLLKDKKYQ